MCTSPAGDPVSGKMGAVLQVFGIIGNPVAHSRSPTIHNAAFQHAGIDAVYVPLLVDDLSTLLASPGARAMTGFSVTIPHKVPCCVTPHHVLALMLGSCRMQTCRSSLPSLPSSSGVTCSGSSSRAWPATCMTARPLQKADMSV